MEDDQKKLDPDEIRAALIAKITAVWPRWMRNEALTRAIELGSNDDLRKHLAFAEVAAELSKQLEPATDLGENEIFENASTSGTDSSRDDSFWPMLDRKRVVGVSLSSKGYSKRNPHHSYFLASDVINGYTGPKWVPLNLFSQGEGSGIGGGPRERPMVTECARKLIDSAGAEALWIAIADQYAGHGLPDAIATTLPARCAEYLERWKAVPKLTPGEYREKRQLLARRAEQLATEVEIFYSNAHIEDGEGFSFMRLLSEEEQRDAHLRVHYHNHELRNRARKDAGARGIDWDEYSADFDPSLSVSTWNPAPMNGDAGLTWEVIDAIVPSLPELLIRLAKAFLADADNVPLPRPNITNAERNYFARELCTYFWRECGDPSPSIIAAIVNIFFEQGISENEVSQIIRKVKAAHPLPPEPTGHESSPDK